MDAETLLRASLEAVGHRRGPRPSDDDAVDIAGYAACMHEVEQGAKI